MNPARRTPARRFTCLALAMAVGLAVCPAWAQEAPKSGSKAGSVRVYRFDNLDIEGNVKNPHLMYFLKRIRNKFRSFRLPEPKFTKDVIETKSADFL